VSGLSGLSGLSAPKDGRPGSGQQAPNGLRRLKPPRERVTTNQLLQQDLAFGNSNPRRIPASHM